MGQLQPLDLGLGAGHIVLGAAYALGHGTVAAGGNAPLQGLHIHFANAHAAVAAHLQAAGIELGGQAGKDGLRAARRQVQDALDRGHARVERDRADG